ncbi:MAG: hypothetical protein K8R02_08280 [Anaerohalosphaeraceae bacterium]|nr:hypothetical protein [Anaerohalosphaeraceae bacterium]
MNEKIKKCIYCDTVNPKWGKAHVVPRLMGAFENQPTVLKKVCADCDREFGECEEILAKYSPEALFKANLGIKGRHKKPSSPFKRKHAGRGPIKMEIKYPGTDHKMLVEPVGDGKNCQIVPHIEIRDTTGNKKQIIIEDPDSLTTDKLKQLIFSTEIKNPTKIWPRMQNNEQVDRIFDLLKQCGLYQSEEMADDIKPFEGIVKAECQIVGDRRRFRAIAKIAFHYFLVHSKVFYGSEPEFEMIRRFIRYGEGNERDFIKKHNQSIAHGLSGNDRPSYYGHILRTEITLNSIAVCVQLFIGHNHKPEWYRVLLSQKKWNIFLQTEEFGHYYRYLEADQGSGYDGIIEKLVVAQVLKIPELPKN